MPVDVRPIEVAPRTRELLAGADFAVSFEMTGAALGRTAEEWARAIFEDPPAPMRLFLTVGWKYGLWLRLGPTSTPTRVQGWSVATSTPAVAVLAADSPLLEARNVAEVIGDGVVFSTLVRYRNGLGRGLWAVAGRIHVLTVPALLRRAAASERPD